MNNSVERKSQVESSGCYWCCFFVYILSHLSPPQGLETEVKESGREPWKRRVTAVFVLSRSLIQLSSKRASYSGKI